jgi:energy-coupling factor transporter ATP-binding protein EcfA2
MEYKKLYFHAFIKFRNSIENIVEKHVDAIFNFTGNFGYTKNELLREVFMDEEILDDIIFNLEHKKNIILQGPSGVGKTFIAKRLCYFHQGSKDNSNIEMIQFHEYYSYEEFVRGYKKGLNGEDYIKNGVRISTPVSTAILTTIFYPGTTLHDGACIIRGNTIEAASVFYTPATKALRGKFGARHRASLGISEVSDAITVVVSEETGRVSFAMHGELQAVGRDVFYQTFKDLMEK